MRSFLQWKVLFYGSLWGAMIGGESLEMFFMWNGQLTLERNTRNHIFWRLNGTWMEAEWYFLIIIIQNPWQTGKTGNFIPKVIFVSGKPFIIILYGILSDQRLLKERWKWHTKRKLNHSYTIHLLMVLFMPLWRILILNPRNMYNPLKGRKLAQSKTSQVLYHWWKRETNCMDCSYRVGSS